MNKIVSLFVAAMVVTCGIMFADVFASRTAITNPNGAPFDGKLNDGSGVKIWYYLNDTATAVVVKVMNAGTNAVVATINASNQGRFSNPNSVTWDGTGSALGTKYYITITTTGLVYSDAQYTPFYFQTTSPIGDITTGIFTRGLDINNNMNTKGFGYWYASNSDGGVSGYKTGTLRYNPDGSFSGTAAGHPILTNSLGTANGGTFNWGSTAPWTTALDSKGRIYQVSNGGSFVTRMDNDSAVPKIIISNLLNPRGIFAAGEGSNLKLYIAAGTDVWRANIGNDDTLKTSLELVASLGDYVRDIILDDAGFLIATLRTGVDGVAPGYIERYDISSGLPKKRTDATMSITHPTGQPVCLALKHGIDKNSASDDTLYYSIRGLNGSDISNIGIHEVTIIDGFFEAKPIFKSGDVPGSIGGNNSTNADLALDWAGNIVWFENSNEEIFVLSAPRKTSTVTNTTRVFDTISVQTSLFVGKNNDFPNEFALHQNYPNPFNPSTVISYSLPSNAKISVVVYDILGNVVKELFNGTAQQGYNAVVWNGTNSVGGKVASGIYLYRITAQMDDGRSFTDSKRMIMLK